MNESKLYFKNLYMDKMKGIISEDDFSMLREEYSKDVESYQNRLDEIEQEFDKIEIRKEYSKDLEGRESNKYNKTAFESSTNSHIKLLFSIEMLNEGVHVEDIDGVIMLRPTISPIIYLQQLGRALSVGHNKHPIIFDIVNNINCHKSIYEVYNEVKKKILTNKTGNNNYSHNSDDNISLDQFKIIDELKQFSDILEMIDSNITSEVYTTSKCEVVVQQLIDFKQQNRRMPTRNGETEEEKALYTAFKYYKRHYTEEQIRLLEENGIPVIVKSQEEKNEETAYGIIEWIDSYGKMPSGTSENLYERTLYTSFTRNKENFDDKQVNLLSSRGVKIESRKGMTSEDIIQKIVDDIISFKQQNNRMPSVTNGKEEGSLYQKFIKYKSKFTSNQISQLKEAGIDVKYSTQEEIEKRTTKIIDKVESTIDNLIQFKNENGRMPSSESNDKEERALYQLYLRTKELYTQEQLKKLAQNGIIVKEKRKATIEEIVADSADSIMEFVLLNLKMPSGKSKNKSEQSLYNSFRRNKTKYTDEQKQRLIEVGVPIAVNDSESHLIINTWPIENQIKFYDHQFEYYSKLENKLLQSYYLGKINTINRALSVEVEQLSPSKVNIDGSRKKG